MCACAHNSVPHQERTPWYVANAEKGSTRGRRAQLIPSTTTYFYRFLKVQLRKEDSFFQEMLQFSSARKMYMESGAQISIILLRQLPLIK